MRLSLRSSAAILLTLSFLVGIPLGIVAYESYRTGMTWSQVLGRMTARSGGSRAGKSSEETDSSASLPKGEKIDFLVPRPIGDPFQEPPRISNVQAVDLDQDGLLDVVVCDCQAHTVSWIRQYPRDVFTESVCAADLIAPAHVEAIDFDADGDLDLLVAVLGMLFPNNDRIGSVVVLENNGQTEFHKHVVVERVARVSDVRGGDLDGDGDMDLAVAQFGYDDGQTQWIENLGGWDFESHVLQSRSGPIHAPIADMDGDGDLDIVVLVSQEWEEIYVFEGDGKGRFKPRQIFASDNQDYGSSGLWIADLDQDGDQDVLYTNGDAFDYLPPHPWPWHGVQWLENRGDLSFQYHRIAAFGGVVGAKAADVDHDGDLDLLATSAFNAWEKPQSQSLIWLENDGRMRFRRHDVTNTPTHLQALDLGDFNGDGEIDLVTGGMHICAPYDRVERVVLWTNKWPEVDPAAEPSLQQEQRDPKASSQQKRLEGEPKPAAAVETSVSRQSSALQGPIEDLNREAIDVADRLVRTFPDNPDAIAVMAMVHHRFGNTAAAVKCLERCLQLDPRSADAYHGLGAVAFKTGDYEKAAALQRKALEIDPTLVGAGVQLADALSGLGKFEEVVGVLENDVKVSPKTAGMLSRLGAAYHRLKEYEKAKENYQAAIEFDPALPDAYYGLAKVYAKLGQRDESRALLKKYQELADPNRKARIERARSLGDRAVVVARESLADICTAAGQVYHRHGDANNAEVHWLKAARLFPEDVVCREELVSLYQQTNRTADTLEILEQLGEIDPGNATYPLHLGVLNARLNRFDAAEGAFKKVRELAPQRPEGCLALVRLYLQSDRKLQEAKKLARAAVELAPTASNYVLLSAACKRNDDRAGAVAAIERAIELDPGNDQYRRIRESLRETP